MFRITDISPENSRTQIFSLVTQLKDLLPADACFISTRNKSYNYEELMLLFGYLDTIVLRQVNGPNIACYHTYSQNESISLQNLIRQTCSSEAYGIVICKTPFENFYERLHHSYRSLPAFAEDLRQYSAHHIMPLFNGKVLAVYTNSDLTLETIYKLKVLQWTLMDLDDPNPKYKLLIEFYKGFLNKNLIQVNDTLNQLIDYNTLKKKKYELLKPIFKSDKENRLEILRHEIERTNVTIDDYYNKLANAIKRRNQLNVDYQAWEQQSENTDYDLIINYLLKHPYIIDTSRYNAQNVLLKFLSPILYYDKDIARHTTKNYDLNARNIANIIISDKYTLYTRSDIILNTQTFTANCQARDLTMDGVINHPHIGKYNCFGSHQAAIESWINNGDYLGCIEQISAATLNLNFSDSIVIKALIYDLSHNKDLKTFQDNETGEMMSLNEILEKELKDGEIKTDL